MHIEELETKWRSSVFYADFRNLVKAYLRFTEEKLSGSSENSFGDLRRLKEIGNPKMVDMMMQQKMSTLLWRCYFETTIPIPLWAKA